MLGSLQIHAQRERERESLLFIESSCDVLAVAPYGRRELFDKWMTPELLFIVRAKLLEISRFAEISLSLSLNRWIGHPFAS